MKTPASWWIGFHFLLLSSPTFRCGKSFHVHINIHILPLIKMKMCYWWRAPSGLPAYDGHTFRTERRIRAPALTQRSVSLEGTRWLVAFFTKWTLSYFTVRMLPGREQRLHFIDGSRKWSICQFYLKKKTWLRKKKRWNDHRYEMTETRWFDSNGDECSG